MVLGETYFIKNWGNFYKKYKMLGGFHKIKDQMLVSMTLYIIYFGVQAHLQEYRCILSEKKMNTCLMETNFKNKFYFNNILGKVKKWRG